MIPLMWWKYPGPCPKCGEEVNYPDGKLLINQFAVSADGEIRFLMYCVTCEKQYAVTYAMAAVFEECRRKDFYYGQKEGKPKPSEKPSEKPKDTGFDQKFLEGLGIDPEITS